MKLPRDQALALLNTTYHGDLIIEALLEIRLSRWTRVMQLVVKDNQGRYWAAEYEEGLTEMQEMLPWDDQDEVKFTEVVKVPVPAFEYRPVNG